MSDIERFLRSENAAEPTLMAPIIYEAWENGWYDGEVGRKQVGAGVARQAAPHFQAIRPLVTEDCDDIGVQIWEPIVTGAGLFPAASIIMTLQQFKEGSKMTVIQ